MTYGKIIILNGASSSGKTSILTRLQNVLDEPYLNAGIDKFIWMLPKRYLDRLLWDDVLGLAVEAGGTGHKLFSTMHQVIALISQQGMNVIADHVMVEEAWVEECARLFAPLPAYFIGIRCPLDILVEREKELKDRTLGQAAAQYPVVHRYARYDLEVDTSELSVNECALRIKEYIEHGEPPKSFSLLWEQYSKL